MPFEIFQSEKTGKYYFRLKARNGEVILASHAYADKCGAKNGIESVINNAPNDDSFERKAAKDAFHYFTLKAANGQAIGNSEMYKHKSSMENGIASVKKNATLDAKIKDLTDMNGASLWKRGKPKAMSGMSTEISKEPTYKKFPKKRFFFASFIYGGTAIFKTVIETEGKCFSISEAEKYVRMNAGIDVGLISFTEVSKEDLIQLNDGEKTETIQL